MFTARLEVPGGVKMRIVNQKDMVTGAFYAAFGGLTALGALQYDLGSAAAMGPGMFPLIAGGALLLIGLSIIATALSPANKEEALGRWAFKKITIVLVGVLLFAVTLEPLGLVIALPLLITVSSFAHPASTWRGTIGLILVMLAIVSVVFVYLLGLSIPLLPAFYN